MISSDDFLTIMLDTPLSSPQLATFLLSGVAVAAEEPYRLDSILNYRIKELAERYWAHLEPNKSETLPIVCINCRRVVGFVMDELIVENCELCIPEGKVSERANAYRRLVSRLKYSKVTSISPIIEYLADNP